MLINNFYYFVRPIIPRSLQIILRRRVVTWKRKLNHDNWPIDNRAATPPEGWAGWPGEKKFALVLHHDVDTAKGQEKSHQLVELEEKMGFRSSFNFVPERYNVSSDLRRYLFEKGFEVCVHGLKHDGKLFLSHERFQKQAIRIRHYLNEWQSIGFVSPSMQRNLDWIGELEIDHDCSTFDVDPFEPQPEGVRTIFPFWVSSARNVQLETPNPSNSSNPTNPNDRKSQVVRALGIDEIDQIHDIDQIDPSNRGNPINHSNPTNLPGFVELPYTLPQDFTLFILMKERNIDIWKKKLDWIVEKGGMALLITHPDYMNGKNTKNDIEEYPIAFYKEFLNYVKSKYEGQYWHPLPKEMARFWKDKMVIPNHPNR
jgi:hypothetical protein